MLLQRLVDSLETFISTDFEVETLHVSHVCYLGFWKCIFEGGLPKLRGIECYWV